MEDANNYPLAILFNGNGYDTQVLIRGNRIGLLQRFKFQADIQAGTGTNEPKVTFEFPHNTRNFSPEAQTSLQTYRDLIAQYLPWATVAPTTYKPGTTLRAHQPPLEPQFVVFQEVKVFDSGPTKASVLCANGELRYIGWEFLEPV